MRPVCEDCVRDPWSFVKSSCEQHYHAIYCPTCLPEVKCAARLDFVRSNRRGMVRRCNGCGRNYCCHCADAMTDSLVVRGCNEHSFWCDDCRPETMIMCHHCGKWGCKECAMTWEQCDLCSTVSCGCECEIVGYPYNQIICT